MNHEAAFNGSNGLGGIDLKPFSIGDVDVNKRVQPQMAAEIIYKLVMEVSIWLPICG